MAPTGLFAGLTTLDIVHALDRPVGPNEKATAVRQDIAAGGPAANAAVAFQALGGDAVLLSALGRHPLAGVAADELASRGVTIVDATPEAAQAPAVSLIRVDAETGERSVSSVNAAGVDARAPGDVDSLVSHAAVVLLDGHHPQLALAAGESARTHGVPVLLDGGSWKPQLHRLMPFVDAAICSADFNVPNAPSTVDGLVAAGVKAIAVTHGGGPVEWVSGGRSGTITPPRVRARDTLGAGDAFHGAAAYAVATGADWRSALEFAVRVAAVRVQHPGPRAWLSALDIG